MSVVDLDPVASARRNQRTAADPKTSVFVSANAGSGKTSTLVDRVARLLLKSALPAEILCVTYTKAAAAEMQTRLFDRLGVWAVANDADLRKDLAGIDGRDPESLSDEELSEARRLFARALETPGGLKIQTIHAFCEKLLRRFPMEAGVSPDFRVLENDAAVALSHEARRDLAQHVFDTPDGMLAAAYAHFAVQLDWKSFEALLSMIEAQREALVAYVAAIEAGPAVDPHALTGVARDQTPATIEADFMAFIAPASWLAAADGLATGSKTDRETAERMRALTPPHATLAAMRPIFCTAEGKPRAKLGTKQAAPSAVAWLDDLSLKFHAVMEQMRAARVADDTTKALTLARAYAGLYEAAKRRRDALDFPDLVTRTVGLLTSGDGAAAWVLFKLDGGIDHVLIDEAQDTAPDQWDILKALTGEFFVGEGADRAVGAKRRLRTPLLPRTVFAVGDEKQSIYSFQGARPERLRIETRAFGELIVGARGPDAFEQVELDTSFRSTEEVLAFVDAAFDGPERMRALTGVEGDRTEHRPARRGQRGSVELWPLFFDPDRPEPVAWTDPVDQEGAASGRKRLARDLARMIRREVETGAAVHRSKPKAGEAPLRPVSWGDYLILVRRRDATFEEIIRALKGEGVPVAGADRLKLSSHIVFDDLIATARFALYPDDDLSLASILRSPLCDISDFGEAHSLYPLADREARGGRSLWRELCRRAHEHPQWAEAQAWLATAIEDRNRDPFAFFSAILNRLDGQGRSGRARILARLGREAEEAIDETLAQVIAAEDRGGSDLETCLSLLEAADVEVKREMEGARDDVRVMTVHGAKGLEAPIVILPDTTSRAKAQGPTLMPAAEDIDGATGWLMCPGRKGEDCPASAAARQAREDRTDAESLRLLYVALTRARERIVVMGRGLKKPPCGFDENSWWDVVSETFDRLAEAGGGAVRTLESGVRRYGVEPVTAERTCASAPVLVALPAWTRTIVPPQVGARLAAPSRMDEALRLPAPSPLTRAAGAPGQPLGRFRRGDLIHRLLERLPEIAAADRPAAAARMLAREPDLDAAQRQEMIEAALRVLSDDRFAPVFGEGSRAEVALTGTSPRLKPGVVISGRIDRLVVTPEKVLVVDYKTNRPAPDRIEDADPAYVLQLAVYVAVLEALYPDRPVEAALVLTDGPRLMPVPGPLMDAALAASAH